MKNSKKDSANFASNSSSEFENLSKEIYSLKEEIHGLNKKVEHLITNGAVARLTRKNIVNNLALGFTRAVGTTVLFALVIYLIGVVLERLGKLPFIGVFITDPKVQDLIKKLLQETSSGV